MQKLFNQINNLNHGITGPQITETDIADYQQELSAAGYPTIPDPVQVFLLKHNGFMSEGRTVFGINKNKHFIYDLIGENNFANVPSPADTLLLGSTETTYIAYFKSSHTYSMIDKSTFMVLHDFNNFQDAIRYILKIDD